MPSVAPSVLNYFKEMTSHVTRTSSQALKPIAPWGDDSSRNINKLIGALRSAENYLVCVVAQCADWARASALDKQVEMLACLPAYRNTLHNNFKASLATSLSGFENNKCGNCFYNKTLVAYFINKLYLYKNPIL